MIRFTWMQFRVQGLMAIGGLVLAAIVLALTGPNLVHLYDTTVLHCSAHGDCSAATTALVDKGDRVGIVLRVVVEVVPALIGLFWGAPLVARELETGTYRLIWAQVTRTRWIAIKLGLLGLVSVAVAGLLSLMVTWWSSPLDRVRLTPFTSFDQRGLVPIGYAAFAFVLGVTAGAVIRRTLPAMAVVLGGFVVARLAVAHWLRPYLVSPLKIVTADSAITSPGSSPRSPRALDPRDWVLSNQTINSHGQVIGEFGGIGASESTTTTLTSHGLAIKGVGTCPNIHSQSPENVQRCVDQLRLREALTYQPISHYWALQWTELAIFFGAAVVLGGFCIWWVRRRLG
jgi:hypothetical protein